MEHPLRLIAIGFGLLVVGAVLPFMIIINLVESTWFLTAVSVLCSVVGITVGLLGITQYGRSGK
jgi:heme/copper-type cytochrome/quinol oxidase subunit 4